jgi:SAM-dependent methyltransferase
MVALDSQLSYWNTTGTSKTFTHPIEFGWLDGLGRGARVLDYGCGYGRVAGLLAGHGFTAVEGVDVSANLIARARERWPDLSFAVLTEPPHLPHTDASVDAVLLFAVLTCVPTDEGQWRLISELGRVLRPGGLLYVSDLRLQDDARNRDRYRAFAAKYGTYGVFETSDGAVCRHPTGEWLRVLLGGFDLTATREVAVDTMNGHPATAVQLLAAKRP